MADVTEFATWTTLRCDCGGERFSRVYSLATRVSGGTVDTPQGWECCTCRSLMDLGAMTAAASLRQLEQEIQQRREQMAALRPLRDAPTISGPSSPTSGS